MTIGVHEATQVVERARKLVNALEAGDGRGAFADAGYGEGDHAQGQRVLQAAEAALDEAKRPPTTSLKVKQLTRAYRGWLEIRGEELKRNGLKAIAPKLAVRHAMDLIGRLRTVARGGVSDDALAATTAELKEWLDRWVPLAKRVAQDKPELAARFGVTVTPKAGGKQASA
jgi:hypothetical protein